MKNKKYDKNKKGYELTKSDNVKQLPEGNYKIAPYNNIVLDNIRRSIELNSSVLSINTVKIIITVFNSRKHRKVADGTKSNYLHWFKYLIEYLNRIEEIKNINEDKALFNSDYKYYLKRKFTSGNVIATHWNTLLSFITQGCSLDGNDHLKNSQILDLRKQKKLKRFYESLPTLSMLYPELKLEANDLELLIGCREVMLWFLNEMNNIRQEIKDNLTKRLEIYYNNLKNDKASILDRYANFGIGLPMPHVRYKSTPKLEISHREELTDLVKVILSTNNDVVIEIMFSHLIGLSIFLKEYRDNKQSFTIKEIQEFFENFWTGNPRYSPANRRGILDAFKTQYTGKNPRLKGRCLSQAIFPTLSFPVFPTKEEKIAMRWLLATDRSQTTGIEALTIENNILIDRKKKTFQIVEEVKHRSTNPHKTPIYHNDNMYHAHSNWCNLIENADQYLKDFDGKYVPNTTESEGSNSYRKSDNSFWLLCTDGTYTNQKIREDFKGNNNEKSVLSFLNVLERHLDISRKKVECHSIRKNILKKRRDAGLENIKKSYGEKTNRISMQTIAQTRAIINNSPSDSSEVMGLVGHNKETHENTYIKRSRSSYVNSESAQWAADVGNAFIEEAQELFSKTQFSSISDIKKILHIKDITNIDDINFIEKIIDEAENNGYITELSGLLKKNGQTIVILTPWTCALIKAHSAHIKSEIERIDITSSVKLLKLQTNLIYFNLLLERFPKIIMKEADKIISEHELPFPSVV